jgi:hypothetical protein
LPEPTVNRFFPRWTLIATLVASTLLAMSPPARAQRPVAPKLLPPETIGILRIADTPLLIERFRQTSLGKIGQDEQVKPLVSGLYGTLKEAWAKIEEQVGLPLDQVLAIPQGEICIALVAVPEQQPGGVFFLDVKDRMFQVKKLLEKGENILRERGGSRVTETIEQQDVAVYSQGNQQFYLIERDGTVAIATTRELCRSVLVAWNGGADKTLADNDKYNSVMSRCAGAVDDPPQVTWFVDPIDGVKAFARGSFAATGLALLPVLGLDGLLGVGGSMTFATGEFDDVSHLHVLLDNPRAGVIEAIAMKSGDTTPEVWVPNDVISYTTLHWDLQQTFDVSAKLYNSLMQEGALQEEIRRRLSDRLGLDFEKELLPLIQGRVTIGQWVEKPVRINSITTIIGVKIKDPREMQPLFDKLQAKFGENLERQRFGSASYWSIKSQRQVPETMRQPTPCFGMIGDYLVLSDSTAAFRECVLTSSDLSRGLANSLDYKLIASKIKRQPGGDAPGMVQFTQPELGLRYWYDLATAETTKNFLANQGERNEFLGSVDKVLRDNPLPPFSVIAQYMAPGGGMMVNDETGIHYSTFTLKRK